MIIFKKLKLFRFFCEKFEIIQNWLDLHKRINFQFLHKKNELKILVLYTLKKRYLKFFFLITKEADGTTTNSGHILYTVKNNSVANSV
jgi:hypothetical protein